MRQKLITCLVLVATLATTGAQLHAANVEFDLITEAGVPLESSQRWMRALSGQKLSRLKLRAGRVGDSVRIDTVGSEAAPTYRVVGALTPNNRLRVPGADFGIRDKVGLSKWIDRLGREGPEQMNVTRSAFGLTDKQLLRLNDRLARPVAFSTKDQLASRMLNQLGTKSGYELVLSPTAQRSVVGKETVRDELSTLTIGTALAATVRPLGLVVQPRLNSARQIELAVVDFRKAKESWPIGWPLEKPARQVAPKMFEFLKIEIDNRPLSESLSALQQRLKLPILFDHNGMARHDISVDTTPVSLPAGRTYYKKAIDRLLFQAKLKAELRGDEAGKPFLWVSTLKR